MQRQIRRAARDKRLLGADPCQLLGRSGSDGDTFRRVCVWPSNEGRSRGIPWCGAGGQDGHRSFGLPVLGCRCRVRVEVDRLIALLDGLFVPPWLGLGVAAAELGRGMIGVKACRLVIVDDRFHGAVQPGLGPSPLKIESGTVRIDADRLRAIGDGFLETVQIGAIKSEAGPAGSAAAVLQREGAT